MAKTEAGGQTGEIAEEAITPDLAIAFAAPADPGDVRAALRRAIEGTAAHNGHGGASLSRLRVSVAVPILPGTEGAAIVTESISDSGLLQFQPIMLSSGPPEIAMLPSLADYEPVISWVRSTGSPSVLFVASDLAAVRSGALPELAAPLLEGRSELVLPIYPVRKFEALLNSAILAPVPRALYGSRVRFPLAPDFAVSSRLLAELVQPVHRSVAPGNSLFWPATRAALRKQPICQAYVGAYHQPPEGLDLSAIIARTVGSLFAEIEANAAAWQKIHGSQATEISGIPPSPPEEPDPIDVRSMVESFTLGFRNLLELWALVLPPVTLVELKRLTRLPAESFRMLDETWVRIIYDFALAYRLRNISRSHLLGALTPLYLGWAASHLLEVGRMRAHDAELRVERLARAFEEGKPYLLSRWRWPDRFNP